MIHLSRSLSAFRPSGATAAMRAALLLCGLLSGGAAPAADTLYPGERLQKGQALVSGNGRFEMRLQPDGRLAVFERLGPDDSPGSGCCSWLFPSPDAAPSGPVLKLHWLGAGHAFDGDGALVLDEDNNLLILDGSGNPVWESGTGEADPGEKAFLFLDGDGDLSLHRGEEILWSGGGMAREPRLEEKEPCWEEKDSCWEEKDSCWEEKEPCWEEKEPVLATPVRSGPEDPDVPESAAAGRCVVQ